MAIDSYTKLLCHFNGTNGGTETPCATGQTVTYAGTAQLSTAQKKFGTASLLLDGNSDYISVLDSDDWNFGSGSYTIDMWVYIPALPGNGISMALYNQRVDASNLIDILILNTSGTFSYEWRIRSGGNLDMSFASSGLSENTWTHLSFVSNGNNDHKVFQGGTQQGSTNTTAKSVPDLAAIVEIGTIAAGSFFNGYIDELRISKGIARWTANFTPPAREYGAFIPRAMII